LVSQTTKSVGHFEENKFSVGGHQFLLEFCPELIKTYNFGQNAVNKSQYKNKNEQYCADRLFISVVFLPLAYAHCYTINCIIVKLVLLLRMDQFNFMVLLDTWLDQLQSNFVIGKLTWVKS
jgi:hypothetical protein